MTIGDVIQPAELGKQPPSVRIEPYLPLHDILAVSDLVVSHGGSGTVVSALAMGRPQLLLSMGADQPDNADRCRELGIGVDLDPFASSSVDIAVAAAAALQKPEYRCAARCIADEARALPDADQAVSLLEALARTASPSKPLNPHRD